MSWVRIDDAFLSHHKVERISRRTLGFWLQGLLYTARNLTDGKIPKSFVRTKTDMALADELVKRDLWEETDKNYIVHDYLEWNHSKAEVKKSREQAQIRYMKWLEKQRSSAVQTPFKQTDYIGKEVVNQLVVNQLEGGVGGDGSEPPADIPESIRAENIHRVAEMAAEAAAKMAMPK